MSPPSHRQLTLHEYHRSGNCYKIRLTASLLKLAPLKLIPYNLKAGETRTEHYLSTINPAGTVPVLQIDYLKSETASTEGHSAEASITKTEYLPESNAAVWYLAIGSRFLPESSAAHASDSLFANPLDSALPTAQILRWLFFEQYNIEPSIGTLRYWRTSFAETELNELQRASIPNKKAQAERALDLIDAHLLDREWFVGTACSVADLCVFGYVGVANEAGLDVSRWQNVQKWVARMRGLEGFVDIED